MWRFWNCVPRFVRQQLHGPRASAGVYVEEEKAEHEVDKLVISECHVQEEHDGTSDKDFHSCGHGQARHKNYFGCRFKSRWRQDVEQTDGKDEVHHEHKNQRKHFCHGPFQSHCSSQDNTSSAHENNDRWKQYCHGDFWSRFCSQHHTLEAVSWGAAVVLGLQLSRRPHFQNILEVWTDPDRRQQWRDLLFRVAFAASPSTGVSVTRSIVQEPIILKQDAQAESAVEKKKAQQNVPDSTVSDTEDKKTLDDVMHDFLKSCGQYAAMTSSVSGLCAADHGQLTAAVKHLQLASQLGHAPAYFNLAVCYEMGLGVEKNKEQAATNYQMAADVGHTQSIFNLALMTLKGEGGITQNRRKAVELLNKCAKQGLVQAQTYLGVYYTENEDGQQDFKQAASFFKAAASQNDAEGQYFLGICYENGWGVESSDEEAARLYSAAAELGHDGAMYNLAAFHEYGLGDIKRDEEEAMSLYRRSAECGNESAKFRLQEVEARKAVSMWSEQSNKTGQVQSQGLQSPGLRRSSHASSPTFTDYMRESITGIWDGELNAWFSSQSLNSLSKSKNGQRPVFLLGDYESMPDLDASDTDMNNSLLDMSQQMGMPLSCFAGLQRTSTMPDMRMVSCQ